MVEPGCVFCNFEHVASPTLRVHHRFLEAMGIGALPAQAFSTEPYCTDWLDTEESERLLGYQRYTYADVVRDIAALVGWRRHAVTLLRPLVRRYILRLSPHLRASTGRW